MKSKKILTVVVRITGLVLVLAGFFFLIRAICLYIGLPHGAVVPPKVKDCAAFGVTGLIPGLYLILDAPFVAWSVDVLFGGKAEEEDSKSDPKNDV
jgi:hypothetical protein